MTDTQKQDLVRTARAEAAAIESQYHRSRQGPCCTMPNCVPTARTYLIAAMLALAIAWSLFFVAVVSSSVYTKSHPMRGYEWIPGAAIVLTLLAFCHMPSMPGWHLASPDERAVHETAINIRVGLVILVVVVSTAVGFVLVFVEWMVPPNCHHRDDATPAGTALLHSSPSPSVAPTTSNGNHCKTDEFTGTIMLAHYFALVCSIVFTWLSVATPPPSDPEDDGIVLRPM